MFSFVFGIPLSFATLITGVSLGLTSGWGVLRYPWTIGKLLLIASVILVGALVIDGALDQVTNGGDAEAKLIVAATWDVVALTTATALAVYKPGPRFHRPRIRKADESSSAEPSTKRNH